MDTEKGQFHCFGGAASPPSCATNSDWSLTLTTFPALQDAPYLDLAPYMPDYYKPQYLLDFEERLPSSVHGSDSLSLNSFNSVTSTNLEWDDSAIAPSSEGQWFWGQCGQGCVLPTSSSGKAADFRLEETKARDPAARLGVPPALHLWETGQGGMGLN